MSSVSWFIVVHVDYTNQSPVVRWGSPTSEPFKCRNGIKQGGVLSPTLFCVYMDEFLSRLEKAEVGYYIGHHYMGAFCHADDVTLVAPSVGAAKKMLNICETYAREYIVMFKSTKSVVLLHIGNSVPHMTLTLTDKIYRVQKRQLRHLGCFVESDGSKSNINTAVCFSIPLQYSHVYFVYCDKNVLSRLFDTNCTSYYGSNFWKLDYASLKSLCVA